MIDLRSALATIITGEPVTVSSVKVRVPVLDGRIRPDLEGIRSRDTLVGLTYQQRLSFDGSGEPVPSSKSIRVKLITNSGGNQQLLVGNQLFDENF